MVIFYIQEKSYTLRKGGSVNETFTPQNFMLNFVLKFK